MTAFNPLAEQERVHKIYHRFTWRGKAIWISLSDITEIHELDVLGFTGSEIRTVGSNQKTAVDQSPDEVIEALTSTLTLNEARRLNDSSSTIG